MDEVSPESTNPYRSPDVLDGDWEVAACSFCGQDSRVVGPIVEAPNKAAYICGACARVAQRQVLSKSASANRFVLAITLFFIVLGTVIFIVASSTTDEKQLRGLMFMLFAAPVGFIFAVLVIMALIAAGRMAMLTLRK